MEAKRESETNSEWTSIKGNVELLNSSNLLWFRFLGCCSDPQLASVCGVPSTTFIPVTGGRRKAGKNALQTVARQKLSLRLNLLIPHTNREAHGWCMLKHCPVYSQQSTPIQDTVSSQCWSTCTTVDWQIFVAKKLLPITFNAKKI